MTNEERLYQAFEKWVDPERFWGSGLCCCLVGQLAAHLTEDPRGHRVEIVADHFRVDRELVNEIFNAAAPLETKAQAMRMARSVLGL